MSEKLLLLEKSSDIESILSNKKLFENSKIITFDVASNTILSKFDIQHDLMENYLSFEDEQDIENLALEKALNWYKQNFSENFLIFEKINLGWLLEIEIHQYILQIMKHMVGIIRIIEQEKPSKIIASNLLFLILNSLKNEINLTALPKSNSSEFYFDNVEIPINLGLKKFNFKTSRHFALKIKKILEKLTNLFFNLKYKESSVQKKNILLLEFNPIQYDDFINKITLNKDQPILLNERRPAVWNFESLKIIRNSKSKILSLSSISNDISNKIENERIYLEKQLDKLFLNKIQFEEYFSIHDVSFWNAIKDDFISTCKQRFSDAVSRILTAKLFFEKNKINCIVTMYNAGAEERSILSVADQFKIPGILLQHGIYAQNNYMQKFIPVMGYLPNLELKEAIWGEETKNNFCELGVNENNLILSGSPRHDKFFNSKISDKITNTILLATNVITGQNFKGNDSRVYQYYKTSLKTLFDLLNNIPGKKLIVKLHPGKPPIDIIPEVINEINRPLEIFKTGSIIEYILNSDVVISTEFSTVLIDAMILKKPTITILFDHNDFHKEKLILEGATVYVESLDELPCMINRIFEDSEYRSNLIKKGSDFIDKYLTKQGNSSSFLANYIHKI